MSKRIKAFVPKEEQAVLEAIHRLALSKGVKGHFTYRVQGRVGDSATLFAGAVLVKGKEPK